VAEEQGQSQERTEQPTAKRLRDARRRGQIARSRELTMTVVTFMGAVVAYVLGAWLVDSAAALLRGGLMPDPTMIRDSNFAVAAFASSGVTALSMLAPLFIVLTVAAILGGSALGGFAFSVESLQPKFSKLNPLSGFKRMFGTHGLMELVKAVAKAGVVSSCAIGVIYALTPRILALGAADLSASLASTGNMVVTMFLVCSASLGIIALVDVPFQLWSHNKKLRMTRKEVIDEMKETEGRPEVKSKIRQLQQEFANQRMLEQVPEADVIVTNPTHFAVALKYDDTRMAAPIVVAKGVDHMAARIREIGNANAVPLFEAPMLARSLYATTEINHEIDPRLYTAVAQLLTYIFQLRKAEVHQAPWPMKPELDLVEELTHTSPEATRH
jgi:flagellar biosynthetic protein FlhB